MKLLYQEWGSETLGGGYRTASVEPAATGADVILRLYRNGQQVCELMRHYDVAVITAAVWCDRGEVQDDAFTKGGRKLQRQR